MSTVTAKSTGKVPFPPVTVPLVPAVTVSPGKEPNIIILDAVDLDEVTLSPKGNPESYGSGKYSLGTDRMLTYMYSERGTSITMAGNLDNWAPTMVAAQDFETASETPRGGLDIPVSSLPSSPGTSVHSNTNGTSNRDPAVVSQPSNGKSGVPTATVAGVAVGCLIAGALIAGLAVWFLLGKARRHLRNRADEGTPLNAGAPEKGPIAKAVSLVGDSPGPPSPSYGIPQPLEDKAISAGISSLANSIKNHVQSFYHSGRVSPALLDLNNLQCFGNDIPVPLGTLNALLGKPEARETALRFCIARAIVYRMQLLTPPTDTLLPPAIAACLQDMLPNDDRKRGHTVVLSKWRAMTAQLMQTTYVRDGFSPSDSRLLNIEKAVEKLDEVAKLYADPRMDNSRRVQNLLEIVKRASTFAFTLFSQQSTFAYDWQDQDGERLGSLCVFPALVQITDEAGNRLKVPRAYNEAIVRPLDI